MKKALKFILSFISMIIILLVSVPIIASMLLQVSVIQNFAVDQATKILSEKSKTIMSISHIDIEFFNRVVIDDAYIQDHRGDTMIYIKKLKVGIDGINFINGKISLGVVDVIDGGCYLYKDSTGIMNVQKVFDHFKPEVPPIDQPNFNMTAREINLIDFSFSLNDYAAKKQPYGINFQAMELNKVNFQGRKIEIFNYDVLLGIEYLTFREKSGFHLQHLSSPRCGVNESGMRFEKLRLETPNSLLQFAHMYLLYDTWYAYNDFVHKVTLDADISLSKLNYRTLAYLINQPQTNNTELQIKGRVRGPIPNLHGFFSTIHTGSNTSLGLSFAVIGLPDITQTRFNVLLDNLRTNSTDIAQIYSEFTGNNLGNVEQILKRAQEITVNGTFNGGLTHFLTEATIHTAQGSLAGRLNVIPHNENRVQFVGNLNTAEFNIGGLLAQPMLRGVSLNANVDATVGRNEELSLTTDAKIAHLHFSNYDYTGISINGKFLGKTYEGMVSSADTNLNFITTGRFDLSDKVPAYEFEMQLNRANLVAIGVNKRDSTSELSAQFTAKGLGDNFDNMNGLTTIEKIVYINHIDTVRAGKISILSQNSDSLKLMKMTSHFADVELRGTNSYSQILKYLAQSTKRYIPSFPDAEAILKGEKSKKNTTNVVEFASGSYSVNVNVKEANNVASIFIPGLEIAQGTNLSFMFDPSLDKFRIDLNSDYIGRRGESLRKIQLSGRNNIDSVMFRLRASVCEVAGLYMPNFDVRGRLSDNQIRLSANFNNPTDGTRAALRTITSIYRTKENLPQIKIEFLPTKIAIENKEWDIAQSQTLLDSTGIVVNEFSISNHDEQLSIDGKVGKDRSDVLKLEMQNFDISPVSFLTSTLGYHLKGQVNGEIKAKAILGGMDFESMLKFSNVMVNDFSLGNPTFTSSWDTHNQRIKMGMSDDQGNIPIAGYFDVKNTKYKVDLKFPNFNMVLLEPLLKGIFTNTSGQANVNLTLAGGKGTPALSGTIDINKYNVKIDYTKAEYSVSGQVNVKNNLFKGGNLLLTDNLNGNGTVDAWFNSNYFRDLSFGVNIHFFNLLALNTTIENNNVFYGKAYGTGQFLINGNERSTQMTINASTALASEIYLPFSEVSNIDEANFITFVDPISSDKDTIIIARPSIRKNVSQIQYTNELDIKINLNVLPNTKAQIAIVNDNMGNLVEGWGDGNFIMHINPQQDIFTMNGSYDIERGSYEFDLWKIFNKRFSIASGSTVNWTGNPADPNVNIEAVYKVKASLEPLTGNLNGSNSNVNIDCGINMSGKLFSPTMKFSITAPSADPETQNILNNSLNTEEAVMNQFMSLFMSRSFTPNTGGSSIGSMSGSMAGATAFEFISNQLSSFISSNKYDIRLGYRPRTETTSDEFSVDFETDIIPNKLSIELGGNYNTGNNPTYNRTPFTGDAYLTYILNKAATLRLKGFTRVIERFDETQGLQESGLGVYYRQDFQTFDELKRKWRENLEENRKKREQRRELRQKK